MCWCVFGFTLCRSLSDDVACPSRSSGRRVFSFDRALFFACAERREAQLCEVFSPCSTRRALMFCSACRPAAALTLYHHLGSWDTMAIEVEACELLRVCTLRGTLRFVVVQSTGLDIQTPDVLCIRGESSPSSFGWLCAPFESSAQVQTGLKSVLRVSKRKCLQLFAFRPFSVWFAWLCEAPLV